MSLFEGNKDSWHIPTQARQVYDVTGAGDTVIATLALAVVLQTLIINWQYVGGSRGAYVIRPNTIEVLGTAVPYVQYLFLLMLVLVHSLSAVPALGTFGPLDHAVLVRIHAIRDAVCLRDHLGHQGSRSDTLVAARIFCAVAMA